MHLYLKIASMMAFANTFANFVSVFTELIVCLTKSHGAQQTETALKRPLPFIKEASVFFSKALLSGTGTSKQPPIGRHVEVHVAFAPGSDLDHIHIHMHLSLSIYIYIYIYL